MPAEKYLEYATVSRFFVNHIFCPVDYCATVINNLPAKMFFLRMKQARFIKYLSLMVRDATMQMKKYLINLKLTGK